MNRNLRILNNKFYLIEIYGNFFLFAKRILLSLLSLYDVSSCTSPSSSICTNCVHRFINVGDVVSTGIINRIPFSISQIFWVYYYVVVGDDDADVDDDHDEYYYYYVVVVVVSIGHIHFVVDVMI